MADHRIVFGKSGDTRPQLKVFYNEKKDFGEIETTWFDGAEHGTSTRGTKELQDLFDGVAVFDSPKPISVLRSLLHLASRGDDIILDFFAGSCGLAQAVLAHNRDDGFNRRFICVQIPEPVYEGSLADQEGFQTISEIGKERIRRVIQRMQAADAGKLTTGRDTPEDLGFRVFKLDRSHYKVWRDFEGGDVADLQTLFDRFESPLVEGWKAEDMLAEVMLMEGFPLDSTTEALPKFTRNTVTQVSSDLVDHRLFVCLDAKVHDETIAALKLGEEDIFICLDSALTDEAKVRLEDGRRVKVI